MAKRKKKPIPPTEDGIPTAAFYGRESSTMQSIEQQRDHCYRWAAQNGHTIIDEYIEQQRDHNRSRAKENPDEQV